MSYHRVTQRPVVCVWPPVSMTYYHNNLQDWCCLGCFTNSKGIHSVDSSNNTYLIHYFTFSKFVTQSSKVVILSDLAFCFNR